MFESATECVPLLSMARRPNWWTVLDEYVDGLEGRVSILEPEMLFGKRWRVCHHDPAMRRLVVRTFSDRGPLHRAYDVEYAARGHAIGKDRVLIELKAKYPASAGLKTVLGMARLEYPEK